MASQWGGNPKKGLCLDMVHELNRPFGEMMLGLESWIPLYMTGQITPWYLPGRQNTIYGHLLFCSGAAAVEGECISGDFSHGRYLFSKSASDLAYYRRRADGILKKARPLMDIYSEASEKAYGSFLAAEVCKEGARRGVLTALPLHTLSEECLRLTRAFAQSHPGYTAREGSRSPFRDIQIFISKGKWVSISKCRKPSIHFVIHHPKLCGAIENMILPLEEQGTG